MKPDLSLIIPTFNERENIEEILHATADALAHRRFEIIVVDDDSPDGTWEIVERIAAARPEVRLVRRTKGPRDQAHAVVAGFQIARGDILGKMDADGSHDPRILPRLMDAIDAGFEVAIGSRYTVGGKISSWPLRRRLLSKVGTALVRATMRPGIKDPLSGFWVLRREIFERAIEVPISGGFKVLLQLCVRGQAGQIAEIPIHFHDRTMSRSKLGAGTLFKSLGTLLSLSVENLKRPLKDECLDHSTNERMHH